MARKTISTTSIPKQPLELLVTKNKAKTRLQDRIKKGVRLKNRQVSSSESFASLSNKYCFWKIASVSMCEPLSSNTQLASTAYQQSSTPSRTKKVFVVHGHDEIAKTNLEIFLHEIGLEPIVLQRQADEGMTIMEKFEKHSDVGYAFILLTPDEVAYPASEESSIDKVRHKEFRARPNVIFEFGYFVGKLGRSKVCCLYKGNVTLPSDVSGMIYKRYEKSIEEVAYGVIKDLKASGYTISITN